MDPEEMDVSADFPTYAPDLGSSLESNPSLTSQFGSYVSQGQQLASQVSKVPGVGGLLGGIFGAKASAPAPATAPGGSAGGASVPIYRKPAFMLLAAALGVAVIVVATE